MEIKSLDDILKLRDEFSRRLAARMKALERPGTGTLDELIEEKRALMKQTEARMQAAERAKAAMVKRLDDQFGHHKETLRRLESELDELVKARQGGARPRGKRKRAES